MPSAAAQKVGNYAERTQPFVQKHHQRAVLSAMPTQAYSMHLAARPR